MAGRAESEEHDEATARSGPALDAVEEGIEALRAEVADADRRLRAFVRERPFVAIGLAVAAGFVVGRVLRRL